MKIDEAIKHAEEVAEQNETQAEKWQKEGGEKWGKTTVCRECAEEHRQLAEWLKELKSLKGKDEPRAVRYEGDGYADGEMVYDYAFCPSCEHETEVDSENWGCDFCPNCGQRLRWEE